MNVLRPNAASELLKGWITGRFARYTGHCSVHGHVKHTQGMNWGTSRMVLGKQGMLV